MIRKEVKGEDLQRLRKLVDGDPGFAEAFAFAKAGADWANSSAGSPSSRIRMPYVSFPLLTEDDLK